MRIPSPADETRRLALAAALDFKHGPLGIIDPVREHALRLRSEGLLDNEPGWERRVRERVEALITAHQAAAAIRRAS